MWKRYSHKRKSNKNLNREHRGVFPFFQPGNPENFFVMVGFRFLAGVIFFL